MLELWVELAERRVIAHRNEHRIVAKALLAARRPHKRSVDPAVEGLGLAVVRPGYRQRADEMRGRWSIGLGRLRLPPDTLHRPHPVAIAVRVLGPPRGEDPGPAMKRINAKAAVVGERGKSAEVRCLAGLQVGVVGKAV